MPKTKRMVAMRMDPDCIESLDEAVKKMRARGQKMSRSRLMREMARNAASFYDFLVQEQTKQGTETITLDGNLTKWVLENCPPGTTSQMLNFMSMVMRLAAQEKEEENRRGA